jgi:hypothetical protein
MMRLCRIGRRATHCDTVLETVTPSAPSPQPEMLAQGIRSGKLGPEDFSAESDRQQTTLQINADKNPWEELKSFLGYVWERRQKIRLRMSRKKQLRSPQEDEQVHSIVVPLHHLVSPAEPENEVPSEQPNQVTGEEAGHVMNPSTGDSGSGATRVPLGAALLMDKQGLTSTEAGPSVVDPIMSDSPTKAPTVIEDSEVEALLGAQFARISENSHSGLNLTANGPSSSASPRTPHETEWISSAMTMKDGQGVMHSVKGFFDTGSVDNLSTSKFASDHKLQLRPIIAEDLMVYNTPNGDFTPLQYFEMYLKDPGREIRDFVKVRFVVVKSLGGMGLVLGRTFMSQYCIKLDPTPGRDMYPVTSRKAGQG